MSKSGLKSGQAQPRMIEFHKDSVELSDTNTVTVTVSIRPSGGVWATKQKIKALAVQVIKY